MYYKNLTFTDLLFNDIGNIGIILIIYVLIKTVGAFIYGNLKNWLGQSPTKPELDNIFRERSNNLTLAGFSLAALTLFLTFGNNGNTSNYNNYIISNTVFYLSISLICFISAGYFITFAINRLSSYTATTLEMIGLISIGIALFLFFYNNRIENINIYYMQIIYGIFFIATIIIAFLEVLLQYKIRFTQD